MSGVRLSVAGSLNLRLSLASGEHLLNEQRVGIGVQVSGHCGRLALVLQPDQRDVVILHETARAGAAGCSVGDGNGRRIRGGVRQRRDQVGEVAGLVDLDRIDRATGHAWR